MSIYPRTKLSKAIFALSMCLLVFTWTLHGCSSLDGSYNNKWPGEVASEETTFQIISWDDPMHEGITCYYFRGAPDSLSCVTR